MELKENAGLGFSRKRNVAKNREKPLSQKHICFENHKTFGTMQKDSQNSRVTIQYMQLHTQKNNVSEERRLYF
jgi:hypothetical protein